MPTMETLRDLMVTGMQRADEFAATHGEEFRPFLRNLLSEQVMILAGREVSLDVDDWKYPTYQDLALDLGTLRRAPVFVPDELGAWELGQCFYNCFCLSTDVENLTYVEGFAQTIGLIVQHAWLEDEDGTIIDPTWANLSPDLLDEGGTATYFGIRFDTSFVRTAALRSGWTSILNRDWEHDFTALRHGFSFDPETRTALDWLEGSPWQTAR